MILSTSAGDKAADAESRAAFEVNLQYDKKGAVKGKVNVTFIRTENGVRRTYQISDVSLAALAVQRTSGGGKATVVGAGMLRDVTNPTAPVVIDAAAPLVLIATDDGEPSVRDAIAVTLLKSGGGLWFAAAWDGARSIDEVVREGNVQVHYGK